MLIAKSHYRQKEDIQLRSAKFNFNLFHLVPVQGFPLDLDETLHQRCLNLLNRGVQYIIPRSISVACLFNLKKIYSGYKEVYNIGDFEIFHGCYVDV